MVVCLAGMTAGYYVTHVIRVVMVVYQVSKVT
jgi:hypothetical protein